MATVDLFRHTDNDGDQLTPEGVAAAEGRPRVAQPCLTDAYISSGAVRVTQMLQILRRAGGQEDKAATGRGTSHANPPSGPNRGTPPAALLLRPKSAAGYARQGITASRQNGNGGHFLDVIAVIELEYSYFRDAAVDAWANRQIRRSRSRSGL